MGKSLQKGGLVAEISAMTGLSKANVGDVLDKLAVIAYREAANGFVIPGICKLTVVKRKASRCRNPATGQLLQIGERSILKVAPLKKAKDMIVPRPDNLVQVIADVPVPPKPAEVVSPPPAAAPEPAAQPTASPPAFFPTKDDGQIIFNCSGCGTMLAAPPQNAGLQGECPLCGAKTLVPARVPGQESNKAPDEKASVATPSPLQQKPPLLTDFITFVCQECGQEIEAPVDMVGLEANCPTCASPLLIPAESQAPSRPPEGDGKESSAATPSSGRGPNLSSMTIRIDLSDLE